MIAVQDVARVDLPSQLSQNGLLENQVGQRETVALASIALAGNQDRKDVSPLASTQSPHGRIVDIAVAGMADHAAKQVDVGRGRLPAKALAFVAAALDGLELSQADDGREIIRDGIAVRLAVPLAFHRLKLPQDAAIAKQVADVLA